MTRRHLLPLSMILALAAGLTFFKVPLASSQGVTLVAAQVTGELPVADPDSSLWQEATAVEIPLSAQNVAKPMILNTKVKSVVARALNNGSALALLLEWADDTQNDSMVRAQDFRDAVAVQFPLVQGQPFFCMGQQGGNVNIWHWKADWQADMASRADLSSLYPEMYVDQYPFADPAAGILTAPQDYTDPNYVPALASGNLFAAVHASPVEDLIAGGFGTLTSQPAEAQNVQGAGGWSNGKWRVIFSRDLVSKEPDDVSFTAGNVYSMAFAAWDGANGERNGQKSTSQWVSLQIAAGAAASAPTPGPKATPDTSSPAGFLFGFVPVLLTALLFLGMAGAAFVLSLFSKKK